MTRDRSGNQMRLITLTWTLNSDWNYRAFHRWTVSRGDQNESLWDRNFWRRGSRLRTEPFITLCYIGKTADGRLVETVNSGWRGRGFKSRLRWWSSLRSPQSQAGVIRVYPFQWDDEHRIFKLLACVPAFPSQEREGGRERQTDREREREDAICAWKKKIQRPFVKKMDDTNEINVWNVSVSFHIERFSR